MSDEPEIERECDPEDEASDHREIERGVFAAVDDVTGEAAETKWKFPAKIE